MPRTLRAAFEELIFLTSDLIAVLFKMYTYIYRTEKLYLKRNGERGREATRVDTG